MKTSTRISLIVLIVALLLLAPFATIWSLNTLFGLGIAYSFWTWLAVVWLVGILGGTSATGK